MEVHDEAEERNTELDLGLHIGDFHAQKLKQEDKSVPRLQLSFALCCPQQEQEEDQENKKNDLIRSRNNNHSSRKKLRLATEQSTLLECTFKQHTTLNTAQKHALAEQLNLTPRQVEVWFQNRRARTKLKQTEVHCEFLKKCCESLSDENTRLKKELQELKSQKNRKSSQLCINSSSYM